ncbi:MAG: tetratricopeptide repeat protein [Pirellulales bacterium]
MDIDSARGGNGVNMEGFSAQRALCMLVSFACWLALLVGCVSGVLPPLSAADEEARTANADPFAALTAILAESDAADDALPPFSADSWPNERERFAARGEAELSFGDVEGALSVYQETHRRDAEVYGEGNWRVVEGAAQIAVVIAIRDLADESDRQAALDAIRGRRRAIDVALTGHYDLAYDSITQARDDWGRVMGTDDVVFASLTHGLAKVEKLRHEGEASRKHYLAALALRQQQFGDDHPRVADTCDGLGMLYLDVFDDPASAREWLERAVAIRRRAQGVESTWYARSLLHLARTHLAEGDAATALELLDESIASYNAQQTDERLSLFLPTMHMGRARAALGELDQAETLLCEARQIAEAHLPPLNPFLAECLDELAAVLVESGEPLRAAAVATRAEHIRRAMAERGIYQPAVAADMGSPALLPVLPARVSSASR